MTLNIYAGKRVLYKYNKQWAVGEIANHSARVTEKGVFFMIIPKDQSQGEMYETELNDLFLDAVPLDPYYKEDPDGFMTKETYIQFIENEDFIRAAETAYMSDGEYYYYPVSKFNKNWLEKQPFDYIVREV